jgi:hypothetical protein
MFLFLLKYTHHGTNKPQHLSYTLRTNVKEIKKNKLYKNRTIGKNTSCLKIQLVVG